MIIKKLTEEYLQKYISLVEKFSNYEQSIIKTRRKYENIINDDNINIYILLEDENLIGIGTLFVLHKIHCNNIGQIEDVCIDDKYRNKGYGAYIVKYLTDYALNNLKCYKCILNCSQNNVEFYNKCGYSNCGYQMSKLL